MHCFVNMVTAVGWCFCLHLFSWQIGRRSLE